MARTFATFSAVIDHPRVLILRYEDHFPSDRETLVLLSRHLGLTVPKSTVDTLFRIFQADNVRDELARLKRDGGPANSATVWIDKHVGDGSVGKYQKRLSEAQIRAVSEAFPSNFIDHEWKKLPIYWSSVLFWFADKRDPAELETLSFSGKETVLVYGPYLCLPTGRWRILPDIKPTTMAEPITFRIDVHVNLPNRGVLQHRTITLPANSAEETVIEFDNTSHLEDIEIRIWSVNDGRRVQRDLLGYQIDLAGTCGAKEPIESAARDGSGSGVEDRP